MGTNRSRVSILIILVVSAATGARCLGAEPQKASGRPIAGAELLGLCELMAAEVKSNYDRLRTWKGKFRLLDRERRNGVQGVGANKRYDGPIWQHNAGWVDFAVDIAADKLFCTYITDGPPKWFTDDGVEVQGISTMRIAHESVLTPEHYLTFQPDVTYGDVNGFPPIPKREITGRLAYRKPTRAARPLKQMSSVFDPRRLFGEGSSDHLRFEIYARYAERLKRKDAEIPFSIVETRRDGEVRAYEIEMHFKNPFNYASVARCEVRSDLNYNMAWFKYWNDTDKFTREANWEYTRVDEVLVPRFYRVKRWDLDTGEFFYDREVELVECAVRLPLDASAFDYAAFNLKRGDRVHDQIENRLLIADGNGKLVSPREFQERALSTSPAPAGTHWLLIGNAICASIIVSLLVVLHKRKTRASLQRSSEEKGS